MAGINFNTSSNQAPLRNQQVNKYLTLCKEGKILQAVKAYKDDTGCSVVEAKNYVDNLCAQYGLSNRSSVQGQNHSTSNLNSNSYSREQTKPSYDYQDSNSLQSVWDSLPKWKKVLNYINMVLIPLIAVFVLVQMCKGPKTKHRKRPRHIPGTQFSMQQPRVFSDFVCPQWKYL